MRGVQRLSKLRNVGAACNYGPKWPFCWVKALSPGVTLTPLLACYFPVHICKLEAVRKQSTLCWQRAGLTTLRQCPQNSVWFGERRASPCMTYRLGSLSRASTQGLGLLKEGFLTGARGGGGGGVGSRREGGNLASAWPSCPSHLLSPVFLALREREGGQMR